MNDLLTKLSDGTLTPDDARALNDLLRGNPEACEQYLNHITLEAQLEREVGLNEVFKAAPPITKRRSIRWMRPVWAAAAAVVVGFMFRTFLPANSDTPAVVTVLFAEDCEWKMGAPIHEGARVGAGTLDLRRGTAILRFDGGAEMVLRGESKIELHSALRARLLLGDVVVRSEEQTSGFTLDTPAGSLRGERVDFSLHMNKDGRGDLNVNEGEVTYAQGGVSSVLKAGHALRLEPAKSPESIVAKAAPFGQAVKAANPQPRPDLMTVYEGFHYEDGSYQPVEISRGKGWAGPWRLRSPSEQHGPNEKDTTTDMRIVVGKLTVPWLVEGGRLGGLEMPAGRSFRIRTMKRAIDMSREGITYFSLMSHEPEHAPPRVRPMEGMRLTFRSSADYWGESLSFGWNEKLSPQIQTGVGALFVSPARIPDEQTLLWIGKIIHRAEGEDEISFRVYGQQDSLDYAEPATWHVVSRELHQSAALDLVVLSSTGNAPRIVDELRIGPTWRSVVPIQPQFAGAE